ncbi:Lys-63-specific deubiquitinase BRCC36 [Cucumis melo var. makuwa]|uniref:Lys-63-specific deubiquitinase BRCC36 n=1 Tax=Cucumis melo var. makuwa TaxID=1194695 RepID=A0A5D3E0G2_CUCMM|nr:Lys-63-specific deubiquitinase BRCC36 [Cucumis melo var. makuwa]
MSEDVWFTCLTHALSTETEEIMGLLLGDIEVTLFISTLQFTSLSFKGFFEFCFNFDYWVSVSSLGCCLCWMLIEMKIRLVVLGNGVVSSFNSLYFRARDQSEDWYFQLIGLLTPNGAVKNRLGLFFTLHSKNGSVTALIWGASPQTRSDRRKDRVETHPEQLAAASAQAEISFVPFNFMKFLIL